MSVYGYLFQDSSPVLPVQLNSVGHEELPPGASYDWDNRRRPGKPVNYVFQYTWSGEGAVEIGERTHRLTEGQAFLIHYPGDSRHYLPPSGTGWSFTFITLYGPAAAGLWRDIVDALGSSPMLSKDCPAIRMLDSIYREAEKRRITDACQASGLAYLFMTELLRAARMRERHEGDWPDAVLEAVGLIREGFASIHGPEELARAVGLSTYHFIRLFRQATGMTTVQYLTRIRMEKAVGLLRDTELSLAAIAEQTGFSSVNYFNRTFRQWVGVTPGRFRTGRGTLRADHITFD
ncbi:AraC family transcriptional regulator [Paenibacillus sacheonensis]|uniref:Helix-turn-helix domain-containing protein n=1 Tax=Paenibacillus sacheonensis TaxID=742054 RepID=A0A7X4YUX9_9BACL|nr:helix-turn-helix domain-containing protein [Paenibacillus sacheonensis]MBM7569174.1 AraC-like DNA-binding protein [Paenibacillus sacheonensis]NBC73000.1 helix-turn-helix domain-containing protein [Paenibacillus sacheonensis]